MKAEQPAQQPVRGMGQANDADAVGDVIDLISDSDTEEGFSAKSKASTSSLHTDVHTSHADAEPATCTRHAAAGGRGGGGHMPHNSNSKSTATAAAAAAALTANATTAVTRTAKPAATFPLCAPRAPHANLHAVTATGCAVAGAAAGCSKDTASRKGVKRSAELLVPEADTGCDDTAQQLPQQLQKRQCHSSHHQQQDQQQNQQQANDSQQQQQQEEAQWAQDQQQQQQRKPSARHQRKPLLVSQQFEQLLRQDNQTPSTLKGWLVPFQLWAKVCNQDDVRLLLPCFDVLLQHLSRSGANGKPEYSCNTVKKLLGRVKHVLQLQPVQQELDKQPEVLHIVATVSKLLKQWKSGADIIAAIQAILDAAGTTASGAAAAAAGVYSPAAAVRMPDTGSDSDEDVASNDEQAEGHLELPTRLTPGAATSGAAAPGAAVDSPAVAAGLSDGDLDSGEVAGWDACPAQGQPTLRTKKQLLLFFKRQYSAANAGNAARPFRLWFKVCNTDDLRLLLLQFDALLQQLRATDADGTPLYSCDTVISYLYNVQRAVQLPELQQLLSSQQADKLLKQVQAAVEESRAGSKGAAATPSKGAAAPAAPMSTARLLPAAVEADSGSGGTPTEQQEQQLQPITVQQLQTILKQQALAPATACNYLAPFRVWANACGSHDLAVLLPQFESLVQQLRSKNADGTCTHTAQTAYTYLGYIGRVLKLPQLQHLLTAHGTVLQALHAAKKSFRAAQPHDAADTAAARQEGSSQQVAAHAVESPAGVDVADTRAAVQPAGSVEHGSAVTAMAACTAADGVHSPQQEQEGQHTPGAAYAKPSLSIQQLQQLVQQNPAVTQNVSAFAISALKLWGKSCRSSDVAVLLQNVQPLLAALSSTKADGSPVYALCTCGEYLRLLRKLLQLPEVRQLMPTEEAVSQLEQQLGTARKQMKLKERQAKLAAAAVAAAAQAAAGQAGVRAAAVPVACSPQPQRGAPAVRTPRTPTAAAAVDAAASDGFEDGNAEAEGATLTGSKKRAADKEPVTAGYSQSGRITIEQQPQQQPPAKRHHTADQQEILTSMQQPAGHQQQHQQQEVVLPPGTAAGATVDCFAGATASRAATAAEAGTSSAAQPRFQPPMAAAAADVHIAATADTLVPAAQAAMGEVQFAVLSVIAHIDELKLPEHYSINEYLSSTLLKAAASYSLLQLQVLHELLNWLLQLPVGNGRVQLIGALQRHQGWLQTYVRSWAVEVELTGCSLQQAAAAATEWYASEHGAATAAAGEHGLGGFLAGLCQMGLKLLAACCNAAGNNTAVAAAAGVVAVQQPEQQQQQQQQVLERFSSVGGGSDALQQLTLALGRGTAALLLHWPVGRSNQERCTASGLWRNCLWRNLQACSNGSQVDIATVVTQVQEQTERMPPGFRLSW